MLIDIFNCSSKSEIIPFNYDFGWIQIRDYTNIRPEKGSKSSPNKLIGVGYVESEATTRRLKIDSGGGCDVAFSFSFSVAPKPWCLQAGTRLRFQLISRLFGWGFSSSRVALHRAPSSVLLLDSLSMRRQHLFPLPPGRFLHKVLSSVLHKFFFFFFLLNFFI